MSDDARRLPQDVEEELRSKFNEIKVYQDPDPVIGDVVLRYADTRDLDVYQGRIADGRIPAYQALRDLAVSCIVWPEPDTLRDILKRRPGVATTLGRVVTNMSGFREDPKALLR